MWVEGREASAVRLLRPSMFYASLGTDGRWWVRLSGRCCAPSWHASACDKVPSRPLCLGTARFLRTRLEGWRCVHPRAMSFMTPARAASSLLCAIYVSIYRSSLEPGSTSSSLLRILARSPLRRGEAALWHFPVVRILGASSRLGCTGSGAVEAYEDTTRPGMPGSSWEAPLRLMSLEGVRCASAAAIRNPMCQAG